jgi:DNA-binding response OmpR family regulator
MASDDTEAVAGEQPVETILIVDDEANVRRAIAAALERSGFRTIQAANGSEAIHIVGERSREIAAITLDLDMPTTNGRETLAMLSSIAPKLPIVVVTGWQIDTLLGRKPGSPGVAYLAKPFAPDALVAALRLLIEEMKGHS